jgi:putative intracellular protease/amidase
MANDGSWACLYAFDGMADWEYGNLAAELNTGRNFKKGRRRMELRTLALGTELVRTMGGLAIHPDLVLGKDSLEGCALLILPGGDSWLEAAHKPVLDLARSFLDTGIPVAAICGATLALGAAGMLDERAHTSNDLGYLKATCPAYRGEGLYRQELAVADRGLVTASGFAPIEFAHLALGLLGVMDPGVLEAWKAMRLGRTAADYAALMAAFEKAES